MTMASERGPYPRTIQRTMPGRPTLPGGIVGAGMRTFVAALVLATASLVGAQVWVTPSQGIGDRIAPGTLATANLARPRIP
jgi:hypothetical protein